MPAISAVNDRLVPKGQNDRSVPYTHWWPKKASTEWISYEFAQEAEISSSTVYWFSDKPWGGCDVPKSWCILYQDQNGQWQPVKAEDGYPTHAGTASTVSFAPVRTKTVRLTILPDSSSGLSDNPKMIVANNESGFSPSSCGGPSRLLRPCRRHLSTSSS